MKSIFTYCLFWFLITTIAYPQIIAAQDLDLRFTEITTRDGLSQNTVSCILQDSRGFMWFGTQDGLDKYDGRSFTNYHYNPDDTTSLLGTFISGIVEDAYGNLWIGTERGVNMFDRSHNNFLRYEHDANDPSSLSGTAVLAIFEDRTGNLWVGSSGGMLSRFDRHNKNFVHFQQADSGNLSKDICSIYEDSRNNIWIGTMNGDLSLFDREKEEFTPFYYQNAKFSNNDIKSITSDSNDNIWISTFRRGLYRMNYSGKGDPEIVHYMNDVNDAGSISSNNIFTVLEDSNGRLWIGTENGGLNLFDRKNEKFIAFKSDPFDEMSLNNNSIWSIYEDFTGNLWIGAYAGGINLSTNFDKSFHHYKHIPGKDNSLSNSLVTSFCEDSRGDIWIGTDGGGINLFDRETATFSTYNIKNSNLGSDAVLSIFEDSRGNLWVGTWGGGLNLFDRGSRTFRGYTSENSKLSSNQIFSIIEDKRGVLWTGSFYGGLSYFDRKSKTFINYTPDNSPISDNQVRMILEDSYGSIWVCGASGLNAFDPETETFTFYSYDEQNNNSLSQGFVFSILEAADSTLWVGTAGGLNKFDRQEKTFSAYHMKDGLPSDVIKGIEEDDQGMIWLSTNAGLSRLNPETGVFINYDHSNGLQDDEFYQCSSYKSRNGEIYFGGVNGFNVFQPEDIQTNPYIPPVVLTDFQIFNKPVTIGDHSPLKTHISEAEVITLSHKQMVFSFEFTALNYISNDKNQYAYKLDGFDPEWNFSGSKHSASYTNLDPGEYTFMVKASNNDGLWNEEGTSVKIIITPPFWKTLWFKIIAILVAVLFILLIFYIRFRQIINRNKSLNEQVIERTKEINEKNTILQDQTEELKSQRDALNLTNSVKDKLFSIISHDLRSPFNTLKGFIELIQLKYDGYSDQEIKEMIGIISDTADNVYSLLDNLLNWSRSQRGKLSLNPRRTDFVGIINNKIELLNYQAIHKNITLEFGSASKEIMLELDPDLIHVVIQNLLTNAIKFTPMNGEIEVDCKIENMHLIAYVRDNGIGLSEEDAEKLFNPNVHFSSSGTENEKGIGLGMLICKDFIEIHQGEIWVESELGKGSTFFIKLPLTQA
ncbi:MAG: two-component regulator propeller domain-containing protein [Bacteroides sp.]|nr:two-component regulator propeller domain-containing protein [Bacteroides sp.]